MLHSKMKEDRQGGFTLIELMFTVTVLAILLGFGIPNFRDFIRNSRMSAQANDLLSGINLTRSEAVKRRAPVTLCSGTAAACVNDGNFSDGWVVFVDRNGNGAFDEAAADVLVEHDAMPDSIESVPIYSTAVAEDADDAGYAASTASYFSYGSSGFRRMADGSMPAAVAMVLCDVRKNTASGGGADMSAARAIEISATGRTVISRSISRIGALGGCP